MADASLRLSLVQRLALTPGLRQSLRVLAAPPDRLAELLAAEAETNPWIEIVPPGAFPAGAAPDAELIDRLAATPSPRERLRAQIRLMRAPADDIALACALTEWLDERGWLTEPDARLAAALDAPPEAVGRARELLQRCEPAGIGARDLGECIALQLAEAGVAPDEVAAIRAALPVLAAHGPERAARRLGRDAETLRRWLRLLRRVDPHPLGALDESLPERLIPDLQVEIRPGQRPEVSLIEDARPRLRIAPLGREAARHAPELLARARELASALRRRDRTLLAIGTALVRHQEGFFLEGPQALRPLSRAALAAELGLHPSTVSRAVAGKALLCPRGVIPLATFFGAAVGDGAHAAGAVQAAIARLIAEEPPGRPLSDAAIRDRLARIGIDTSRRTVAKYRLCMGIPSSRHRRRRRAQRGARA